MKMPPPDVLHLQTAPCLDGTVFSGTLMVGLPCREGWVIAEDRLVSSKTGQLTTEMTKIFRVGQNFLFCTVGALGVMSSQKKVLVYLKREIEDFWAGQSKKVKRGSVTPEKIDELAKHLASRFEWGFGQLSEEERTRIEDLNGIASIYLFAKFAENQIGAYKIDIVRKPEWSYKKEYIRLNQPCTLIAGENEAQELLFDHKEIQATFADAMQRHTTLSARAVEQILADAIKTVSLKLPNVVGKFADVFLVSHEQGIIQLNDTRRRR